MEYDIYKYCAIIGSTLVGIQVVLQAIGVLGDTDMADAHDVDVDVDAGDAGHIGIDHGTGHGNVFFGVLSLKALTAFAGIFGLVGMIMSKQDVGRTARVAAAMGAGVAGMFVVGWMMRGLSRLQSSGTIRVRNAVGCTGTVYLRIPERRSGRGKVTVAVQGRTVEFPAVTEGEAIAAGASVTVEAVEGEQTLKVVPV